MTTLDDLRLADAGLRSRMATLLDAPAELLLPERILLYALVRALRPRRCLEIGSHFGGSTAIIAAALDDVGEGVLVCVDPVSRIAPDVWTAVRHRTSIVEGPSPEALPDAHIRAGGLFDFAFIDGDHSRAGVTKDIEGVMAIAANGACLLFHDAHSPKVTGAVTDCLTRHGSLVDCGLVSTLSTVPIRAADGTMPKWGGLHMLRLVLPARADGATR
jgi:predicted O-methyltransferase YrrM